MDFSLGEDLQLFGTSLDRFLGDKVAAQKDKPTTAADAKATWLELAELGVLTAGFGEADGGLELGEKSLMVIMRQFGKHLFDSPFLGSIVIAGNILAQVKNHALAQQALGRLLAGELFIAAALYERDDVDDDEHNSECRITQSHNSLCLNGTKQLVENGATADSFLVSALDAEQQTVLLLVPARAEGVEIQSYQSLDGASLSTVTFNQVRLSGDVLLAQSIQADELLDDALALANFAIAADTLGAVEEAFRRTLEYLPLREQFGRKLSSFQALQHRCSDLYTEIEMLHGMVLGAAVSFARGDRLSILLDTSAAKALAVTVGDLIGREAIQLHGAVGMTEELGIGSYLMRANRLARLYGELDYHRERIIDLYVENVI